MLGTACGDPEADVAEGTAARLNPNSRNGFVRGTLTATEGTETTGPVVDGACPD